MIKMPFSGRVCSDTHYRPSCSFKNMSRAEATMRAAGCLPVTPFACSRCSPYVLLHRRSIRKIWQSLLLH